MISEAVLSAMVGKYPELNHCKGDIQRACILLEQAYRSGGKVLVCGNGGSASDSEHIVGELMKGFMSKRPIQQSIKARLISDFPEQGEYLADHLQGALSAISLVSHTALLTAYANDVAADMVFAQQVFGYGVEGDVLIGLSTSGNSRNVIHAFQVAQSLGLHTIALTGRGGGEIKRFSEVTISVPWDATPDIQERHLPIYHALCMMLEERFFPA